MGVIVSGFLKSLVSCFSYKKGSLTVTSLILSVPASVGFQRFKGILMEKFNTEEFVLNLFVIILLFFVLLLIVSFDALTGVMKAKKLKEDLTSTKGLVSIFKFILYTMFLFIVMIFQGISVMYGWETIDSVLTVSLFTMTFLITLWEFKSIGSNLEVIFNKKIEMFNFIDRITDVVETMIIDKIRNSSFCKTDKK